MNQRRHIEPLPLGTEDEPYSKGLMARALVAVGVPGVRAYDLARRSDKDLEQRGEQTLELERLEELAGQTLGEQQAFGTMRRLRQFAEPRELDLPLILLAGGS